MKIRLIPLNADNKHLAEAIKVSPEQAEFVPPIEGILERARSKFAGREWWPFLITSNEQVVGSVTLSAHPASKLEFTISGFFIDEEFQGQGIGANVLSEIEVEGLKSWPNTKEMNLVVSQRNTHAIRFYLKNSFVASGQLFNGEEKYTRKF